MVDLLVAGTGSQDDDHGRTPGELTTETQRHRDTETQRHREGKRENTTTARFCLCLLSSLCLCVSVVPIHPLTVDIGNEPSTLTSSHCSCRLASTRLTLGSSVCP